MDYKDTLLMPNTAFEMRGNLPKKEPGIQEKWEKMRLYDKMVEMNKGLPLYVLHDGPPYANGNLHMGTAMNRCLKDFVVKSKHMSGHQINFYPGWDTHGLPIENAMPKLGYDRKKMSVADFREKCEEYARQQIEIQKTTMRRLGTMADFDHPYITLHKSFEADQIRTFGKMALKGLIFQGMKPIYWSPERESAVADSEIEYHDRKDPTIFVMFDVKDGKGVLDGDEKFVALFETPEAQTEKNKLSQIKEGRKIATKNYKDDQRADFMTVVVFKDAAERADFMKQIHVPVHEQYVTADQVYRLRE